MGEQTFKEKIFLGIMIGLGDNFKAKACVEVNAERMKKLEKSLNRVIEGSVVFLVIFTPLAFGSVEVWAKEIMKILIFVIAAAWLLKKVWIVKEEEKEKSKVKRIWTKTGLEIPAVLFIALIFIQLAPLPPSALKVISPQSYELYKKTLPGYETPEGVNYEKLDTWLLAGEKNIPEELREIILKEGEGRKKQVFNVKGSNFRSISVYPYLTREQFILLIAYLALFFIVIDHYRTKKKVYNLLLVVIITGLLIASFGILQKLTWNGKIYWLREPGSDVSPFGPFVNPDHFAGYMELIVPLAFGLFFTLLSRKIETDEGKAKWQVDMGRDGWSIIELEEYSVQKAVTLGFLLAITVASIFMSLSRGGLVATSITFILFALLLIWGKKKSIMEIVTMASVLGVSFIVLIALGLTPVKEKIETLTGFSIESAFFKGRQAAWTHTLEIVRDFPVFGSGLGTFRQAFLGYYPSGSSLGWLQTHNDYLQLLSEVGLIGFTIFLIGLFIFVARYYWKAVFGKHNVDRYINLGLAMAIFSLGIHSLVDFNLQIPSNGFLFVVIMALLIANIHWSKAAEQDRL
jgi:O-antigen ligase